MSARKKRSLEERLKLVTQGIAKRQAREILAENRKEFERKEVERKAAARRQMELGELMVRAGVTRWENATLLGLILHGRDNAETSATAKLAMTKRGDEALREQHGKETPGLRLQ